MSFYDSLWLFWVSQTWLFWYFFIFLFCFCSFIPRVVFIYLGMCSSTKMPESTDQFPFGRHFSEHLTSLFNKRQKRENMTAMKMRKLHFKWWLVKLSLLTTGISKCWCPKDTWHLPLAFSQIKCSRGCLTNTFVID